MIALAESGQLHVGDRETTILDDFLDSVERRPDDVALVSYLHFHADPLTLTYRDMGLLVDRLAAKLLTLGVQPQEFVAYQFTNRWEFAIAHLATIRIGAISNPLMPIFGKRELRFMLERTKSRVCLGMERTNKASPGALLREIQQELDSLEHLILIDDTEPGRSLDRLLDVDVNAEVLLAFDRLKPASTDLEVVHFSSGTTGEPKGVLHSFASLFRCIYPAIEPMKLGSDDVILMSSPLAHATGFNYGLDMPLFLGSKFVFQEIWDPELMLRIIENERVTWTMGAAAFAKDACDAAERMSFDGSTLRCFASGGAPIPPQLIGRTSRVLGAQLLPLWGSTEIGIATLGRLTDSDERRASSDGTPVHGVSVRIVDDTGAVLPLGTVGHIQVQASGQHVGYFMNDELYNSSFEEGWFKTGDLGHLDKDNYIRIVGRSKDIVIRGGENIPIIEVENLLMDLPEVTDIAIIGVPDDRLGERCHAVIVPKTPGHQLTLTYLTDHLEKLGVTKSYWPEFLSMSDALPRTASGKIQRFVLRDKLIAGTKN